MACLLVDRVEVPFRLYVTSSHFGDKITIPESPYLLNATVLPVENRGRDILPFLHALAAADDFEIGLKLHTKKSPQRADGAQWRADLLSSLLPSRSGVSDIVTSLVRHTGIGLVAPSGFCLPVRPWVLENGPAMNRIFHVIDHDFSDTDMDDTYFAAGSMFWFRKQALSGLTDPRLMDLFEQEEGQLDGTIAHAMERIFPVEARRRDYLSVAMPAIMQDEPDVSDTEIMLRTHEHALKPSLLFPSPYVSPDSARFEPSPISNHSLAFRILAPVYRMLPEHARAGLKALLGRK
ncbi:hypothetical protein NS365_18165 [Aureimonas ureilytica]|uniref:Uncharacterized protein n=2 Tax=Aureimonas ureilytica TaxID=401562 RepID=A0A175RJF3_9HYPH|nr:hypothetical protein NS365_18165 [Aureimonas ureilytica]